jgi:hypothetical protein
MRRRRLHPSLDVLSQRGLVVLDAQQRVGAVLQHQCARGLGLGVQGLQADFATVQIEFLEEWRATGISWVLVSTTALPRSCWLGTVMAVSTEGPPP